MYKLCLWCWPSFFSFVHLRYKKLHSFVGDFELISGKYIVDAKSILGLFSVDLSKPVLLRINTEEEKLVEVLEAIDAYRV